MRWNPEGGVVVLWTFSVLIVPSESLRMLQPVLNCARRHIKNGPKWPLGVKLLERVRGDIGQWPGWTLIAQTMMCSLYVQIFQHKKSTPTFQLTLVNFVFVNKTNINDPFTYLSTCQLNMCFQMSCQNTVSFIQWHRRCICFELRWLRHLRNGLLWRIIPPLNNKIAKSLSFWPKTSWLSLSW